jgi:ATP-GRASP peptide maturase of grasp-with-spasm system
MILIFSSNDGSTSTVCQFLNELGADYEVINPFNVDDFCSDFESRYYLKGRRIEEINVVWYRRSGYYIPEVLNNSTDHYFSQTIINNISQEKRATYEFLNYSLQHRYWLNTPNTIRIPKIIQLNVANQLGINTPRTILTTSKKDLIEFSSSESELIIKPIDNTLALTFEDGFFLLTYTTSIDETILQKIPETFFPCLIQARLDKEYEIRSFYIEGDFYSMAIFSQKGSNKTKIDFRNEDVNNKSRRVPYQLPKEVEVKLHQLMLRLGLNCGSFDIVKTREGEYVFLEVNPVGQFGMVSIPCNYYLEKIIAEHLFKKSIAIPIN